MPETKHASFTKTMRIGQVDEGDPSPSAIVVIVNWNADKGRLSFTGTTKHQGGQVSRLLRDLHSWNHRQGWSPSKAAALADVWDRWHLNDMRAGCEHQRDTTSVPEVGTECDVCGYRYGSQWRFEEVPNDVLEWLLLLPGESA